jgi:hypothetical protein
MTRNSSLTATTVQLIYVLLYEERRFRHLLDSICASSHNAISKDTEIRNLEKRALSIARQLAKRENSHGTVLRSDLLIEEWRKEIALYEDVFQQPFDF